MVHMQFLSDLHAGADEATQFNGCTILNSSGMWFWVVVKRGVLTTCSSTLRPSTVTLIPVRWGEEGTKGWRAGEQAHPTLIPQQHLLSHRAGPNSQFWHCDLVHGVISSLRFSTLAFTISVGTIEPMLHSPLFTSRLLSLLMQTVLLSSTLQDQYAVDFGKLHVFLLCQP